MTTQHGIEHPSSPSRPHAGVSRRTVVAGTAWAVPAVVVAAAAPASAASGGPCAPTLSFGPGSCFSPIGGTIYNNYNLYFCLNTGGCTTGVTIKFDNFFAVTPQGGGEDQASLSETLTVPVGSTSACLPQRITYRTRAVNTPFRVTYSYNNNFYTVDVTPPQNAC